MSSEASTGMARSNIDVAFDMGHFPFFRRVVGAQGNTLLRRPPSLSSRVHRVMLGRRSWLFDGSDRWGVRTAAMYTVIVTARLNKVDIMVPVRRAPRRERDLPALNAGALEAAMAMLSPVCGLRPWRRCASLWRRCRNRG